MTKKILIIVTTLFFAGMLFLTFFAEKIHESSLPEVTASRPEQRLFPYEYIDENGEPQTGLVQKIAVPKSMIEEGVFVVCSAEKNGTKRSFVRYADIQIGEERDGYVEIVSGILFSDQIVTERSGELYDGAEIRVGRG